MRKVVICLVVFFVILTTIDIQSFAADDIPTRVVNLVYDDSGSMIESNSGKKVDTWCQAKYAMEVFASMLSENDTMNVYVMSDFQYSTSGSPKLVLKGSEGTKANVEKVHKMVTTAGNTPFNAVRKAEQDLEETKADEKWLAVLTDGEFEDGAMSKKEIDKYFESKPDNINVIYFGMGSAAGAITENKEKNIYYVKAKNNNEILEKLTEIGTQVYNRDRLELDSGSKTISFDIPMSELIVFAQGEKISINGIKDYEGKIVKSTEAPVTVQYSNKAANNYSDILIDKSLRGSIATFQGSFKEGKYSLDVSGAETIEVYYKPDVEVAAYLKKGDKEVTNISDLEAGKYVIGFSLVKAGTNQKIKSSKLLGDVQFEAQVKNNDKKHDKTYKAGDTISIEEGPLTIDATAHYLGYHTVDTHLDYSIYKDKEVGFEVIDNPEHIVTSKGFKKDEPLRVKAKLDGKDPSEEQWNTMDIPKVTFIKEPDFKMGEFKVEKSDDRGVFDIYPSLDKEDISGKTYKDVDLDVSYKGKAGNETWVGSQKISMKMGDERSWIVKHKDIILKLGILLLILALILGYVPGVKHYLPRKLKKRPVIYSKVIGSYVRRPQPTNGDFQKNRMSTVLPYVAEKGVIRYVPRGIPGAPKLQVKGIKGRRMQITNMKDFGKKKNITFDGERVDRLQEEPRYQKKFDTSSGLTITAEINGTKYTCNLNE